MRLNNRFEKIVKSIAEKAVKHHMIAYDNHAYAVTNLLHGNGNHDDLKKRAKITKDKLDMARDAAWMIKKRYWGFVS